MLRLVWDQERPAGDIAARFDVTFGAVSQHLRVLEDAGLVSRPLGRQPRPVRLEAGVFDLMEEWIERYRRQAEERYRRLDAVLAEMRSEENPEETEK
jgi:DNA-binding transcriptional ArsR family regulator